MRKPNVFTLGFILLNMAAIGGCAAAEVAASEENEAPAQETYVKMSAEAIARLRADVANGVVAGPDIPEGAEVLMVVANRTAKGATDDSNGAAAPQASVTSHTCEVQDVWNSVPVGETVMVCTPTTVQINERIECDQSVFWTTPAKSCPTRPTACQAHGYQNGQHAVSRPGSAASSRCQQLCVTIQGEETCGATPANCEIDLTP